MESLAVQGQPSPVDFRLQERRFGHRVGLRRDARGESSSEPLSWVVDAVRLPARLNAMTAFPHSPAPVSRRRLAQRLSGCGPLAAVVITTSGCTGGGEKTCSRDIDCPSPQLCVSGRCIAQGSCTRDIDCPEPQVCQAGICVAGNPPCTVDGDCSGGMVCQAGVCVPPISPVTQIETYSDQVCPGRIPFDAFPAACKPLEIQDVVGLQLQDLEGTIHQLTIRTGRIIELGGQPCAQCTSKAPEVNHGTSISCSQRIRCGECAYSLAVQHDYDFGRKPYWRLAGDYGNPATCPGISGFVLGVYQSCPRYCDPGAACGGDGCGGSCGECAYPLVCNTVTGTCKPSASCVPECNGLECGDDGCGGECGTCVGGRVCLSGRCSIDCFPQECSDCLDMCNELGLGGCCTGEGCVCNSDCPC